MIGFLVSWFQSFAFEWVSLWVAYDGEARLKMKKRLAETQSQLDEIRAKDGVAAGVAKKGKPLSFRWSAVATTLLPNISAPPTPRSGHAAWTISGEDPRIFVHGGAGAADDRGNLKDVEHIYALNTESLKWNIAHTYKKPRHRTYHTVSLVGPNTKLPEHLQIPRLLCFGGYNQGSIDNDNYALIKWSVFLDGQNSHMKIPPQGLPVRGEPRVARFSFVTFLFEKHPNTSQNS